MTNSDHESMPEPPPPPAPQRSQFSLAALLGSTLAASVLMALFQYLFPSAHSLPEQMRGGGMNSLYVQVQVVIFTIFIAIVLYTTLRLPFVIDYLLRRRRRWQELGRHRAELQEWTRRQKAKPSSREP